MKDRDRESMPLPAHLIDRAERVSFHMPGHRQGRAWSSRVRQALASLDTTELPGTGDLAAPSGHVLLAFQRAASAFGAGRTWFITSGTTSSVMIMLSTALREGDALLVPRASHLSVVHAVALLGLRPVFIDAADGHPFEDGQPDASSYVDAIRRHPEAQACFVTYPDYYGRTIDLKRVARAAEAAGMLLLVDEAHGAHFAFLPDRQPATALSLGADMVCQSAHKTLPALTMASLLHVSEKAIREARVDLRRLGAMIGVFQTSSPSFLIASTIDMARDAMETSGTERLKRIAELNASFSKALPEGFSRVFPKGADPTRLVIDFSEVPFSRKTLAEHLERSGIDVEMIDIDRMVLIPAPDQPSEDYEKLLDALRALSSDAVSEGTRAKGAALFRKRRDLCRTRDRLLSAPASFRVTPREALFGQGAWGAALTPYPPGLPILWPGEPVEDEHRSFLKALSELGIAVRRFDETQGSSPGDAPRFSSAR